MMESGSAVSLLPQSRRDEIVRRELVSHEEVVTRVALALTRPITLMAEMMVDTLRSGGKIVFFGNGAGAACAQYWASMLVGRYGSERSGLSGLALTADTVVLTNIGNDYGYHDVFARQVEALVNPDDVVVGICTTGASTNVLAGVRAARIRGARTVGLSGGDGGQLTSMVDQAIVVPSAEAARILETYLIIVHIACRLLEDELHNRREEGIAWD